MKVTGLSLMVIAVGILLYCAVAVITLEDPGGTPPPGNRAPIYLVPLAIAIVTGIAGLMLYVYGGDGYKYVPHPPDQPIESRERTNSVFGHG
jgi:hypothetical protein